MSDSNATEAVELEPMEFEQKTFIHYILGYCMPSVTLFGVVGNTLSIYILRHKAGLFLFHNYLIVHAPPPQRIISTTIHMLINMLA